MTLPVINTGFDLHVSLSVGTDGERPKQAAVATQMLRDVSKDRGKPLTALAERWFDVTGHGYETNWMWVIGGKFRAKSRSEAI